MIWFWVPASLVICNDIFAYVWGVTLGRTPLFTLSPKKTVEGFVGALFSTIIIGVIVRSCTFSVLAVLLIATCSTARSSCALTT